MVKVFAFPMAPANYTIDNINNVYKPMGIRYAFVHGNSEASDKSSDTALVLDRIKNPLRRIKIICHILKENDVFIVNSYTEKISLQILLLNIFFFRKPMGISSDTQLCIPASKFRGIGKSIFLRWLFARKYIYGLPGGTKTHVALFSYFGMSKERIFVLPMMVNNEKYRRVAVSRSHEVFKFVVVGRLIPLKQVDKVITAFYDIVNIIDKAELHIIGDGVERERLKTMVKDDRVIFHGAVFGDDKIRLLHEMDCLILYSNFEQWGLVVNEALASGIPCIVSDVVGARLDLVEGDDPTGIVVSSKDCKMLSLAMKKIATDVGYREYLSRNARHRMDKWSYHKYRIHLSIFITSAGIKVR